VGLLLSSHGFRARRVSKPHPALPEDGEGKKDGEGEEKETMWRATVLTIFPEMFPGPLGASLAGKASGRLWSLQAVDIRDYATDKHRSVDDTPAGGGPGMVMRADVIARAIDAVATDGRPRLLMSPRGRLLTQARVRELAAGPGVAILCGRFEGVDERVIAGRSLEEVSIGDYVLSGGEIAAMAMVDACVRLIPGVMGKEASATEESFSEGLLEYPQFTRPQLWEDRAIPEVLVSGDHAKVRAWRREEAERLTRERRPDLWAAQEAVQDDNARATVNAKGKPKGRSDSRNKGSTEG
jgi:tRNA (guanine37-N1)-methyltransferase